MCLRQFLGLPKHYVNGDIMRKVGLVLLSLILLSACDKHDPILSGVRTPIFEGSQIKVLNKTIPDTPSGAYVYDNTSCKYTQDSKNVIWDGDRKVFSGFATNNTVSGTRSPVCSGKYLYAGLSTGEVVKLNPKTRAISWISDVYRFSNLTGGASMLDVVAPIIPYGDSIYVGGLGDAFCRINATGGEKRWCVDISVGVPFVLAGNYAFVVSMDGNLNAISIKNGDVFWRTPVSDQSAPVYSDGVITVGKERINVADGKKIE